MICAVACGQNGQKNAAAEDPQQETEQKVCDNAEFEGKWSWSSEEVSNDLTITNVTSKTFVFSFLGIYINSAGVAHLGDLEGTALFTAADTALFEYSDEENSEETVTVNFVFKEGKLFVTGTDNCYLLGFGLGVRMDGEYVRKN